MLEVTTYCLRHTWQLRIKNKEGALVHRICTKMGTANYYIIFLHDIILCSTDNTKHAIIAPQYLLVKYALE